MAKKKPLTNEIRIFGRVKGAYVFATKCNCTCSEVKIHPRLVGIECLHGNFSSCLDKITTFRQDARILSRRGGSNII